MMEVAFRWVFNDPPDVTSEPARKKAKQEKDQEEFDSAQQLVGDADQPDEQHGLDPASSAAHQEMIAAAAGNDEVELSDCPLCGQPHFTVHVVCPTCLANSYS